MENKEISLKKGDRGCIYARLSEKDRKDNPSGLRKEEIIAQSIRNQIILGKKFFDYHGYKLVKIYVDKHKSAYKDEITLDGSTIKRKEFKKLLEESKINDEKDKDYWKFVWVKDLNRWSRVSEVQKISIKTLNKNDKKIVSQHDDVDDPLIRDFKGLTSEQESREKSHATREMHKTKLDEKIPISRPPKGYKIKRDPKTGRSLGKWLIDVQNSKKIIQLFEDFVYRKMSYKELQKKYRMTEIKRVLSNKTYLGVLTYNDMEKKFPMPLFLPSSLFHMAQTRIKKLDSENVHTRFKRL